MSLMLGGPRRLCRSWIGARGNTAERQQAADGQNRQRPLAGR